LRIFITGWDGLVGRELRAALAFRGAVVDGGDLPLFDVRSETAVRHRMRRFGPDQVVHLAAWTDVDACESDLLRAFRDNGDAVRVVARAAASVGARMLHVSTDYVFPGDDARPLREDSAVAPRSVYGASKLAGEQEVRRALPPGAWTIVRGQSLYGAGRKSFPDAILRAATTKTSIPVVTDQFVCPTWARDFAAGLVLLIERGATGDFHLSASDSCSWNEFARAVLEEAAVSGVTIAPTTAAALARPAPRPSHSLFDLSRFEAATGVRPRTWREMLREYLATRGSAA
jgi:dTDP-4-dehydrorhamnose reductase